MNAIVRLFLAHFIADFPLQFDEIFVLKKKSYFGCLLHALIHAFIVVLFFFGNLGDFSFWLYVILLIIVHSLQDWGKVRLWVKPEDDKISYFLLDQFFHYLYIFAVRFFPFSKDVTYYGKLLPADVLIYYNDMGFITTLAGVVLAGWGGSVMLYYLDKSIYRLEVETLNRFERSYGVVERGLVAFFIVKGGIFYVFIPFLFLIRLSGLKNQPLYRGILSLVFASIVGVFTSQVILYLGYSI
ncbi:MAG: DUF3307 domain-containing protein [Elusimicrobia bacterium]|nr:DUF3307 domain-containing protein [Elusimicrobiota bacterium]